MPPENLSQQAAAALALLEADQVVEVKRRTRFGRRRLSAGLQLLLWGLRIYVVLMLVLVAITVVRAAAAGH